jgi:non-homologous end joining protein Ku
MPKSPPATRAAEHVTLSLGLIAIPMSVFTAVVSDHGVRRNMFVGDETAEHPIGYQPYDKVTGQPVEKSKIVKKVATEYGHVYVEDHEIEQLFNLEPKTIKILAFQPIALFYQGHYVPKTLYYLEADKIHQGRRKLENKPAVEAFDVLLTAMRKEGVMALTQYTTRGVQKPAILLPDGSLWLCYYTDELREQRPLPHHELRPELVSQARALIKSNYSDTPVDISDKLTATILDFAQQKALAGDFGKPAESLPATAPATSKSNNLMELLTASLHQAG